MSGSKSSGRRPSRESTSQPAPTGRYASAAPVASVSGRRRPPRNTSVAPVIATSREKPTHAAAHAPASGETGLARATTTAAPQRGWA